MNCDKHGISFERTTDGDYWLKGPYGSIEGYRDCPKCLDEHRQRCFSRQVREAHIPPRFVGKEFDSFEVSLAGQKHVLQIARDYAVNFERHKALGRCLVFSGKVGTGKTLLASAIATALIRSNRSVFYSTAAELIRWIRSAWRKDSGEDESSILKKIQSFDLLILDEIGLSFGGDAEIQQLTEAIDLRYRETRPTLVASNYSLHDMPKYLGERGVDRLKDNGGLVAIFNWESYRGRNGN